MENSSLLQNKVKKKRSKGHVHDKLLKGDKCKKCHWNKICRKTVEFCDKHPKRRLNSFKTCCRCK